MYVQTALRRGTDLHFQFMSILPETINISMNNLSQLHHLYENGKQCIGPAPNLIDTYNVTITPLRCTCIGLFRPTSQLPHGADPHSWRRASLCNRIGGE